MTASDAPQDHDVAQKHAALYYFRKPSRLSEFRQLGLIVRDILAGTKASAPGTAGLETENGAQHDPDPHA